LALLNKAAEQEGQEDEGNGAQQDLAIHPTPPSPEMAPIFKPESGTPSSHKRGSHGRRLAKQGGEVSLPHGEGAHPSGKRRRQALQLGRKGPPIYTSLWSKSWQNKLWHPNIPGVFR